MISPGSYNFGNVPNGTGPTPAITFTITNTGTAGTTAPLVILKTGANAAEFSFDASGCFAYVFVPIPAGGSCQIRVTFSPDSPLGKKSASLIVSARAGEGTPHAGLSGTSTAPALLVLDPTDGNFGSVAFGSPSDPITFTIVNNGYATSGVLSIAFSGAHPGDFTLGDDTCSGNTVAVFAYCTFEVIFTPGLLGPRSATVKVSTPNPAEGLPTASLEGLGV